MLTVSAHSMELGRDSSYYGGLMNSTLRDYPHAHNATRDTVYFREMVLRDIQAVRFMKQYFGENGADERFRGLWNSKQQLILSGGSQGGFQSAAVAALERCSISTIRGFATSAVAGQTGGWKAPLCQPTHPRWSITTP